MHIKVGASRLQSSFRSLLLSSLSHLLHLDTLSLYPIIMVFSSTLLAGITLATAASAAPLSSLGARAFGPRPSASPTSYGTCTQQMMPVTVNAEYTKINIRKPTDQATLTGSWPIGGPRAPLLPSNPCLPTRMAVAPVPPRSLPITFSPKCATPILEGRRSCVYCINFDHSYWEFGYSKEYNFIEAATKAGYAVFTHDRLGVGQSDKPDGLSETQAWTELTGIANKYPDDLDAVVLTGYTPSMITVPLSFTGWSITLAKEQPDASIRSHRFAFFAEGSYDEGAFQQAYNTKQTFTMGEFMTIGEPISQIAPDYKGDVFVVTGEKDLIFCGGNCNQKPTKVEGNSLLDDTKTYFPNCKSFNTYVPPGAGHALFTHHGTDVTMSKIMEWAGRV
ncbi:alpha/beta hydrolase family protein [Ceratobasidium sp. AG-Ba]|nr:alpha/beta hydrolase family protein [Ceratobasidium sp. AG-Ba]